MTKQYSVQSEHAKDLRVLCRINLSIILKNAQLKPKDHFLTVTTFLLWLQLQKCKTLMESRLYFHLKENKKNFLKTPFLKSTSRTSLPLLIQYSKVKENNSMFRTHMWLRYLTKQLKYLPRKEEKSHVNSEDT